MASFEVVEGNSLFVYAHFQASSSDPNARFSYTVNTSDGSAMGAFDYVSLSTTGSVGVGYSVVPYVLKTIDDSKDEGDEVFFITLSSNYGKDTATITIKDNDRLKCVIDLDGDGKAEEVELSFSDARQRIFQLESASTQTYDNLVRIRQDLLDTETLAFDVQKGARQQLASVLLQIGSFGLASALLEWISFGKDVVKELYSEIKTGSSDGAAVVWMQLAGLFESHFSNTVKLIPLVNLGAVAKEGLESAFEMNKLMIELTSKIKTLSDQLKTQKANFDKIIAEQNALYDCLAQAAAANGTSIQFAEGVDPATALDMNGEILRAPAQTTAEVEWAKITNGLYIGLGSAKADVIVADAKAAPEADAAIFLFGEQGDDSFQVAQGNAYVDGGAGVDRIVVLTQTGDRDTIAATSTSVVDAAQNAFSVVKGERLVIGGMNVEYVLFSDGFYSWSDGKISKHMLDPVLTDGARNVLRNPDAITDLDLIATTLRWEADAQLKTKMLTQLRSDASGTTSVAILSYEFFTGKTPSAGGLDYLVSTAGPNQNNLNSAYYQTFNLENRYINFAVNLGKLGEGKDAFAAQYGSLSLLDATKKAYTTIFGAVPTDAKVHALVDPRADYFAFYGKDGAEGIGAKAAMVGWLLAEAVKADIGMYAKANDAYLTDLADGAAYAIDLVGVYGKPEFSVVA